MREHRGGQGGATSSAPLKEFAQPRRAPVDRAGMHPDALRVALAELWPVASFDPRPVRTQLWLHALVQLELEKCHQEIADAQVAREHITHELTTAKEPRPKPAIAGELDIEPQIVDRSAHPDDVLAWIAGLGAAQRAARRSRLSEAQTPKTTDRSAFAISLADYLAGAKMRQPFQLVARARCRHWDRAVEARCTAHRDDA